MPALRASPNEITRKPVTVRAVHANAGVEAWYAVRLADLVREMHLDVERAIVPVYGSTMPEPEHAHDAPRNPSLVIKRALRSWGDKWVKRFDDISQELGQQFATKAYNATQTSMRAALKDAGFTVKFAPTPGSRAAYQATVAEQVNLIKSIPQQYLKDVESKVWQSVMKGSDMHTLSVDLRKTYGVTRERAALISRDQNNKAKAVIEKARRQELGITHAIWQHSAGGKTPRKTHIAMSGKAYLISEGMYDSDAGQYVLPGELINCRCTSRAIIPAFETVEQAEANARRNTPALQRAARRAR